MFRVLCFVLSLVLQSQVVYPQVLSRSSLVNLLNRPGQDILEGPINYVQQPFNQQIVETPIPNLPLPPISSISPITNIAPLLPVSPIYPVAPVPSTTTIITDCSPSVCKNLANTLQLMIVCNLLQNTQGGSELAVQLATPIINEVISSPNFPCGTVSPAPNPVSSNLAAIPNLASVPTIITPNMFSNVVSPIPSYINAPLPNYINAPVPNSNGILFNLL